MFNTLQFEIFACGFFVFIIGNVSGEILVQTKTGPVKGYESYARKNLVYTFKNIPYAKQPVGKLRFQLPEEVDPWVSEDSIFQEEEIYCPQFPYYKEQKLYGSAFGQEDCLFLDVYSTKAPQSNISDLPVLVYFHGGRYSHGSKEEYGAKFLLRFNEIILVIPNYRLGLLGFLSAQDSILSGNLGLWDQREALKWVFENIKYFRGDTKRITIGGHDAGGASVGFHILSPSSHGYFTAAISASGTALDPWAMNYNPLSTTMKVAESLSCPTNSTSDLLTCLKKRRLKDLLKTQSKLKNEGFLPTLDYSAKIPFLHSTPEDLYERGYDKNVSYLTGITEYEASVEVAWEFPTAVKSQHLDKIIQHFLRPYLKDVPNFEVIATAAKYHYLRGVPIPTFSSIQPQIVNMMSDFLYKSSLDRTLRLHSEKTSNTFMYVFNFQRENVTLGDIFGPEDKRGMFGASHMEDVIYIFNTTFAPWMVADNTSRTLHMIEILCKIWGEFITLGSLTFPSEWKHFNENNQGNYAEISEAIRMKTDYRQNDIAFWTLLVPDLKNIENSSTVLPSAIHLTDKVSYSWGVAGLIILIAVLCVALVGVVAITRRRFAQSSIIPVSSPKEDIKYRSI